ncbi:hypothetical protein P7K49_000122, partial [Saguinus oedipus]
TGAGLPGGMADPRAGRDVEWWRHGVTKQERPRRKMAMRLRLGNPPAGPHLATLQRLHASKGRTM